MYSASDNYKAYIKKPSRTFDCKIVIGSRTFTNSDIIQIVPEVVQPQEGFSIGNTVSQSLEITLKNDGGVYASVGVADVSIGLNINGILEYVPIGVFNIYSVDKTDYTVKLTCYDNMITFETGYYSSLGDTPTLQQVVDELASTTGVEFTGTLPNYTVTKLEGYTCREVLAYVASVCGGNAYITRDGKFTIVYPIEVDCTITADNYISTGYTTEDSTYTIGMITCQNVLTTSSTTSSSYDSSTDTNTISAGTLTSSTMELTFVNPWVTTSILNDILTKLNGFSYLGYDLKWQGDLALDAGDIVTIVDNNNVTRKAYVYANKLTYTGGLVAETSAKGETKNSNSFTASGSSTQDIARISVNLLIAQKAIITKANIQDLEATNATIENLDASIATINTALISVATISQLVATNATITNLTATTATITQLNATNATVATLNTSIANINSALISKANIADLTATNATVSNLNATVATIQTLVNGNLTSANIQSLVLTSSKITVDNGFIKNAMIESLDVTKINAGTLNTNKISVSSSDGGLIIAGATQQFKDSSGYVRLQLGEDTSGNFSFILRASDGTTTLIDGTGVHANAIANKLIQTNMVADSAIGSQQINYSSFVTGFNATTNANYINASKVAVDLTGQTLDISFSNLNTTVNGLETTTSSNVTSISAIQGQISTLISNTTITTGGTTTQLIDAYNGTVNTINSMQTTIGTHTSEINANTGNITSLNSSIASLQVSVNSISANLTSTQSTVTTQATQISSVTTTANAAQTAINNLQVGGRNLIPLSWLTNVTLKSDRSFEAVGWVSTILTNAQVLTIFAPNTTYCFKAKYTLETASNLAVYDRTIGFNLYSPATGSLNIGRTLSIVTVGTSIVVSGTFTTPSSLGDKALTFYSERFTDGTTVELGKVLVETLKIEQGNTPTDWSPAPEDVTGSIASVNTTANNAVTTANAASTTATSASGTASTASTNASNAVATANAASTSASSAVSTANTANTTANSANTTANAASASVTTLNTTVTSTTNRVTALELTTSGLTTTVSNVQTSLTSLTIGGRNLLINSSVEVTGSNEFVRYADLAPIIDSDGLVQYTISFDIKSADISKQNSVEVYMQNGAGAKYTFSGWVSVTTQYTRQYVVVTPTLQNSSLTQSFLAFYGVYGTGNILSVKNVKVELGNKATDYTVAPEDVASSIAAVQTYATNTINSNVSTINQTTNSISANVSSLQSSVSTINTTIGTLATSATVTAISNTVASLQTSVTGINASITSLNSNVSSVTTTANSAQTAINSLQVGGRNLLKNTIFKTDVSGWTGWSNQASSFDATDTYNGYNCMKIVATGAGGGSTGLITATVMGGGIVNGQKYTVSFYAKGNAGGEILHTELWGSVAATNLTLTTTWTKYTAYLTGSTSAQYFYYWLNAAGSAYITLIKLEEGNQATDWTPAPEDVDSSISAVNTTATTASTNANNAITTANTASSTATTASTNASSAVTTANSASTNASSAVTTANSANSTASTANTTANSAVSTANTASTNASNAVTTANAASASVTTLNTTVTSTTNRVTALELTTSGLTTTVSNVQTTINSITIGGRNLILDSSFELGSWYTSASGNNCSVTYPLGNNSQKCIALTSTVDGDRYVWLSIATVPVGSYMLSYDVKCNTANQAVYSYMDIRGSAGVYSNLNLPNPLPTTWTRISVIVNVTNVDTALSIILRAPLTIGGTIIYYDNFKLEKGNKATDWSPAPEDVTASIASVNTSLTTNINSNVATINQTTNSISANVTSLQSSVATINTTLGTKADSTTVTSISSSVAALQASVTGINASIATTNTNVTSVTTTANAAQSSINNLQIGGRNLIPNSKIAMTSNLYGFGNRTLTVNLIAGNTYTFSMNGRVDAQAISDGKTLRGYVWESTWTHGTTVIEMNPTVDTTVSTVFTAIWTGSFNVNFYLFSDGGSRLGTVTVNWAKLELGNKATDWTPAPEDVDSQITTVNTSISTLQSSVSVLQSQIALKVQQTDINTAIATVNGSIATTNTNVTNLQSSINLQLASITTQVNQTVSSKNLINNSSFNNTLGAYNTNNTPTLCSIVTNTTYIGWGYVQAPINSNNALHIRYDSTGDNYCDFIHLYAKVNPSTTYTLSYYYTMNGEYTGASSFIYERTAANWNIDTYSTPTGCGPDAVTSRSTWVRRTQTFTTQSTTDSIMLRFGFHQTHTSGFCEILITGVQLELGSTATAFVDSTTSQVGTSITQSTTDIMTAFNNISSYFQVNSSGATFGDTSTGAYTQVSSSGLTHVDSTGSAPYFYCTYVGTGNATIPAGSYQTSLAITLPAAAQIMFAGKSPRAVVTLDCICPSGQTFIGGAYLVSVTSTTINVLVQCYSYNLAVSGTTVIQTGGYVGGFINFRYTIIA